MTSKTSIRWDALDTPIGVLGFAWSAKGLTGATFKKAEIEKMRLGSEKAPANPYRAVFHTYFRGEAAALSGLALDLSGTGFQMRVWEELLQIPAGATRSYSDLARAIGMPYAVRAVGAANGKNPVSIAVPCHRVVGKNGALTGYAGGLRRKAWLLAHERRFAARAA